MPSSKFILPILCLASALTASGAGTARFNVASGAWETGGTWSTFSGTPTLPPSAADTVSFSRVGGASVTLSGDYSVAGFSVTSATILTGSSSLRTLSITAGTGFATQSLTLDQTKLSLVGGSLSTAASLVLQNGGVLEVSTVLGLNTALATGISSGGGSGNAFSILSGTTTISGGDQTFTVGSGVAFTSNGTLGLNRGTFDTQSASGSLAGTVNYVETFSATFKNSGTLAIGALTVGGNGSNGGTDVFENAGTMNLGAVGAVNFNAPAAGSYTIRNSGGGTFNINSGNTVTIAQAFQQTGASTLNFNSPTLVLSSAMSINAGTVIGNLTGATGDGDATFASGSSLSPGAAGPGNVGTIAFPDALTLSAGSTLTLDINTDVSYDKVQAIGAANITGANLAVSLNGAVTGGTVFTILSGASVAGTFSGLAEGATVGGNLVINYGTVQANAVTLTAVPEPGFYAGAFGLGLAGFAVWRSNRRRA